MLTSDHFSKIKNSPKLNLTKLCFSSRGIFHSIGRQPARQTLHDECNCLTKGQISSYCHDNRNMKNGLICPITLIEVQDD